MDKFLDRCLNGGEYLSVKQWNQEFERLFDNPSFYDNDDDFEGGKESSEEFNPNHIVIMELEEWAFGCFKPLEPEIVQKEIPLIEYLLFINRPHIAYALVTSRWFHHIQWDVNFLWSRFKANEVSAQSMEVDLLDYVLRHCNVKLLYLTSTDVSPCKNAFAGNPSQVDVFVDDKGNKKRSFVAAVWSIAHTTHLRETLFYRFSELNPQLIVAKPDDEIFVAIKIVNDSHEKRYSDQKYVSDILRPRVVETLTSRLVKDLVILVTEFWDPHYVSKFDAPVVVSTTASIPAVGTITIPTIAAVSAVTIPQEPILHLLDAMYYGLDLRERQLDIHQVDLARVQQFKSTQAEFSRIDHITNANNSAAAQQLKRLVWDYKMIS